MGFIYPGTHYEQIILRLHNDDSTNLSNDAKERVYWNIFPVQTATMEAYATVYCYFDRTNIFDSGIDGAYVDQYDQLMRFRMGYGKEASGDNAYDYKQSTIKTNDAYINRLDDPTLKYKDPW